ncbi:class I adenylate-forming enzyme family protein [Sphingomonas bacterium]|uniref:class I adenylate-forming enzyme family protein n=1 Tax=Sphingomonas bacterium TaxID=1895847 RepID=UPI0015774B20|nr:fatty acid--CoA ligase family protein [Sphingomonas bacterium]
MTDLAALIEGVMAVEPDAPAVEWEGRWLDWRGLASRIAAVRAVLDRLELPQGARVGIMLRNRLPQLQALYAVVLRGDCLVTVNPTYPDAVVAADIAGLDLAVVIAELADLERPGMEEALSRTGTAVIALPGAWEGEPLLRHSREPGAARCPATPATMIEMLTSGTTGTPKRVALTRRAFRESFEATLHYEHRSGDTAPVLRSGVQILVAPLTHIGGIWSALNSVAGGRRIVLLEKFAVAPWHRAVATYRPAVAGATAAGLRMILDADLPRKDLASLRALIAGTAAVDPATIDTFLDRYGIPVLTNYGATEFAGPVAGWSLLDFKAHWGDRRGSVGRLHAGVEARVVDAASGAVLPPMADGVLELRSTQLPDPDRWFRTTDLARLAEDGFLWITGRADAAIIRGGFKVHPAELVSALEAHPDVREAVVVGLPDARLGAVPVAAVMLRAGVSAPADSELDAFLRARLLPYQLPVFVAVVDDVPRTGSMKPILPDVAMLIERLRTQGDSSC